MSPSADSRDLFRPGGDRAARPLGPAVRSVLGAIVPVLIVLAWWAGIQSGTAVVPTFGEVFDVFVHMFETPDDLYTRSLGFSLMMTLIRLGIGFGLGVLSGVLVGLWAGTNAVVEAVLNPVVQMARPVNPIVLLPIATVLFGLSSVASVIVGGADAWRYDVWDQVQLAMIVILWWGTFFPVFLSTVHGVRGVRRAYLETMTLLGADRRQVFRYVIFPSVLPGIANGMRVALGVAWLVLIAAEIFPGTRSGLGYMLCVACKTSDYQYTFAAIITIGLVGFLMDSALSRFERAVSHWQAAER